MEVELLNRKKEYGGRSHESPRPEGLDDHNDADMETAIG